MEIGIKIKKMRKQQHRTLQDIADACGFTRGLLSKIENGVVVPPVATLSKIAKSLGVKVSVLLEEGQNDEPVFTRGEAVKSSPHVKTDKGYEFYTFAPEFNDKKMQPCLFFGKKGEVIEHSLSHSGEEFIYMLEGEMKVKVGKIEYILKSGDGLYFNSLESHGILPITDEIRYINLFAE